MIEYFIFQLGFSNNEKSVKMRSEQQGLYSRSEEYVKLVKKQGYGAKAEVEHAS